MSKKIILKKEYGTRSFARKIAEKTIREKKKTVIIALIGDLGVGKTTFVQEFGKALGIRKRILSPTFLLLKRFELSPKTGFANLYHIDAYRAGVKDFEDLGIKGIFAGNNIVLIEWADRIKKLLPRQTAWLKFKHINENEREVIVG